MADDISGSNESDATRYHEQSNQSAHEALSRESIRTMQA